MAGLKIGIVEDELLVARSISVLLQKIGYSPIRPVRTYDDALEMIRAEDPDLLLIDIVLEGKRDGIELADELNRKFHIPFIFLTANSDSATVNRAKEVKPYAYLVKPFNEKDLYTSIEIAFNNHNLASSNADHKSRTLSKLEDYIFVKEGDVFHRVDLHDVLYIESDHVYLHIHTQKRNFLLRTKLEDFINDYGKQSLLRVHRSYAVNIKHLESLSFSNVKVAGRDVPMNHNYRKTILDAFNAAK